MDLKRAEEIRKAISVLSGVAEEEWLEMYANTRNDNVAKVLSLEKKVNNVLEKLRIPPNIRGYDYLKTSIELGLKDKKFLRQITKELYPRVAEICNTTPTRVERAIRHALEVTWSNKETDECYTTELFGVKGKYKPTNSEFLASVVKYIELH